MNSWIDKGGYETRLLASSEDVDSPGVEIQLVRFRKGKFEHHHKIKTEFFYFTGGSGKVLLDGDEQQLEAGVSFVVKPNVKHTFINDSNSQLLEAIMMKTNNNPEDTFSS